MSSRVLALLVLVAASLACGDPAHDNAVAALGGEANGVPPGPTHRPGQPCGICHGGSGPGNTQFAIAGTVFAIKGQSDPLVGALVTISDSSDPPKPPVTVLTNSAGNFYIPVSQWTPKYPLTNISVSCGPLKSQSPYTCGQTSGPQDANAVSAVMHTIIGREGSCAGCHFGVPGPTTRGPIYLATSPTDLPGATPTP